MISFTIIMATYNQGEFIETAIRSVLDQKGVDVELIVYDAMSSDNTPEVLARYKDRLTWIRRKDRGMVDAINQGLQNGRGTVVAWLNSDDAYLPLALQRASEVFGRRPDVDFVYGDALEINREGFVMTPNLFTEDSTAQRYLYSHNFICQPTMFFRREVVSRVGLLREDLQWTMDYEWFARFFLNKLNGFRTPYFLAANRDYATTKTNSGGASRYREMMSIHRIRPGPPMVLRRAFWIYTFEAMIKGLNATHSRLPALCLRARAMRFVSRLLGAAFLRVVNPRCRQEIIQRFQRDIQPYGRSIQDQWASQSR